MISQFNSRNRWLQWMALAILLAAIDQAIKLAVSATMPLYSRTEITPWFNWVFTLNKGAAFSFLADQSGWQRYFFIVLGIVICATLAGWLWRGIDNRLETAACIAIIGGGLGNVVDRIRIGAVVDYLDFHWAGWHWPAFNLADIGVVSGAGLMILATLKRKPELAKAGVVSGGRP